MKTSKYWRIGILPQIIGLAALCIVLLLGLSLIAKSVFAVSTPINIDCNTTQVSVPTTTALLTTTATSYVETTVTTTTTTAETTTTTETMATEITSTTTTTTETTSTTVIVTETVTWDGPKLTPSAGTVVGPSGEETYYNLDMSLVVSNMQEMGYTYEYWVRDDDVKMFGDYVMIAANLDIRPYGTVLETSLGLGMVCDTGLFADENPYQIDIAVNW